MAESSIDHRSADLKPGKVPEPDEVKRILFSGPWIESLSRSRIIENLYLVAAGIRPASMFHPANIEEMVNVNMAARSIGLGLVARKAGERVFKMFIFSKERAEMAAMIPDIDESMGEKEFIVAQITLANFTGAFLGFPKCCVDDFVGHLMRATDQDLVAMERLKAFTDADATAYFVERFVPCSPDCSRALEEGERIEDELSDTDPELLLEYLKLREDHLRDVREGRIVEEKKERDLQI